MLRRRKAFHCDRFPADAADGKNRAGKSICLDADKKEPEKKDPGQVILDDSEKLIPEDIPHELIFRVGNPGSVLLDLSFEKNCDLVIMGNRGRSALKSLFMGSVSSHLASNVKCPILIIK